MKAIVVDTNILIQFPQILAFKTVEFKVIVPDVVLGEYFPTLEKRPSLEGITRKVKEAETNGVFEVGATDLLDVVINRSGKLSVVDQLILEFAKDYRLRNPNDEVQLATLDRMLAEASSAAGILVLSLADLKKVTTNAPSVSFEQIAKIANENKASRTNQTFISVVVSAISGLVANLVPTFWVQISSWLSGIISVVNIWGTIVVIPVLGLLLFWARSRYRLIYGIVEAIIGFTAALWVFLPAFDLASIDLARILQFLAGLYVIVRGLDNVGVGLQSSSFVRASSIWNRVFSKRSGS